MTKKKVLILTTSYPNEANPVAGVFVSNLAAAMSSLVDVSVVAPRYKRLKLLSVARYNIDLFGFDYAPKPLQLLAQGPGGIPAALKKNKAISLVIPFFLIRFFVEVCRRIRQVDYVQANWVVSGFVASFPCFVTKKTMILTLHGEDVRKLETSKLHQFMFFCAALASKYVVCVGQEMYDELLKRSSITLSAKLKMLPNGIEPSLFDLKPRLLQSGKPVRVLMVSSLVEIKSVDHALHAFSILIKKGLKYEVTLVGDGPLSAKLKMMSASLGLSGDINFRGILDQSEVYKLYEKHDIFLICSRGEGRSSVVMEAMAAGLIVVGSDVRGVSELLRDLPNKALYPFGDIDALSCSLEAIAVMDNLLQKKKENQMYALKFLSTWDQSASEYLRLMEA